MNPGDIVRVDGERGTFRIVGTRADGTVDLWGGTNGKEKFRTVTADRIKPARRGQLPPASAAEHRAKAKAR